MGNCIEKTEDGLSISSDYFRIFTKAFLYDYNLITVKSKL